MTKKQYDIFRKKLGKEIKNRREIMKISTRAFAKLIDKHQSSLCDIEKGVTKELDSYEKCLKILDGQIDIKWNSQGELKYKVDWKAEFQVPPAKAISLLLPSGDVFELRYDERFESLVVNKSRGGLITISPSVSNEILIK